MAWTKEHGCQGLCREQLDIASYLIYKLWPSWFKKFLFKFFRIIRLSMFVCLI